jgi:quercetin dioxygenase-like cupin family protein
MANSSLDEHGARPPDARERDVLDVLGRTVQFLTRAEDGESKPCILRGVIPPGVIVPLHSHTDPETYFPVSGEADALAERAGELNWQRIRPGDVFHVPGNAKHAFRNWSTEPAVMFIVTTPRIGRFFEEVGTPARSQTEPPGPPSRETMRHFRATAERYGYWNATPEENARVGLTVPAG